MAQENLKLLSVRIDPETIEKIDAFTNKHYYWKRNTVINRILTAVMNDFNETQVYDMVRKNLTVKQNVKAEYELL